METTILTRALGQKTQIYTTTWFMDDPLPVLFHLMQKEGSKFNLFLHQIALSLSLAFSTILVKLRTLFLVNWTEWHCTCIFSIFSHFIPNFIGGKWGLQTECHLIVIEMWGSGHSTAWLVEKWGGERGAHAGFGRFVPTTGWIKYQIGNHPWTLLLVMAVVVIVIVVVNSSCQIQMSQVIWKKENINHCKAG